MSDTREMFNNQRISRAEKEKNDKRSKHRKTAPQQGEIKKRTLLPFDYSGDAHCDSKPHRQLPDHD